MSVELLLLLNSTQVNKVAFYWLVERNLFELLSSSVLLR